MIPSSVAPVAATVGRSNDWRRASTTWMASPAAIASLAAPTARMYWSRPRLVSTGASIAASLAAPGPPLRAAGPASSAADGRCGPLERLEDGRLGDAVAALEVRRLGVERRDRRERVGEVVEHDDEVGLDERRHRDADRIALRERHGRLERGDRVVREGPDRATGEAGHALDRQDPATRHERADRLQRVARRRRLGREVRVVRRDGHRAGLDVRLAVADLEEPARTDAQERVPTEALAALDRLEQVGRPAVVEAKQGPDRRLEVGRTGRAQQDRVGGTREALGLRQTERIGGGHPGEPLRIKNGLRLQGRKAEPSAVPPSFGVCRTHGSPGSRVHSLVGVVPARTNRRVSGSTLRRVLVPFTARSSRCGREYGRVVGEPSSGVAGIARGRRGNGFEAGTREHGQRRIAREARVGDGPLAQEERAAGARLDAT